MTYRELAQLAGVSVSTVSKVMAGNPEISEGTAHRIRELALEHGVRVPNYHRNHKNLSVAILVPELVSYFYAQILTAIHNFMRQNKIDTTIHVCGFTIEEYIKVISNLRETGTTDGIIFLSRSEYCPADMNIPLLFLSETADPYESFLSNGLATGFQQAVELLVSLGHKEIGFIGEKNTLGKEVIFHDVLQSMNLPDHPEYIFTSDKRFEEIGYEAGRHFVSQKTLPTAFIAAYDEVAIGAIHAFTEMGIRVPEDVSIIGINDVPCATYASVPLTTIRLYNEELLSVALKLFFKNVTNENKKSLLNFSWQCQLIVRKSTAKPREWELHFD